MKHITFISVFVLVAITMISCKRYQIHEVNYELEYECVWVNDTENSVTIKWFYEYAHEMHSNHVQIDPGAKLVRTDWSNHRMLYHSRRVIFSFSDCPEYQVECLNPVVTGGLNCWDSLSSSSIEIVSDVSGYKAIKAFYLSDVWNQMIAGESIRE